MTSRTTRQFRERYAALPEEVQRQARAAYRLFRQNPAHPGLHFKRIHNIQAIHSVRIGIGYRAVGIFDADQIVWHWIGSHSDYDKLLAKM